MMQDPYGIGGRGGAKDVEEAMILLDLFRQSLDFAP
jgi:hypothetical protein